jgi:tyrosyl-tRNA synthetase
MEIKDIEKKINDIFSRGVGQFVDPSDVFKNKLREKAAGKYKKDIIVKYGADPSRPDIHLGHAVNLRKLRQLQDLGCKIVFLIGDFTAQIGDPTGKSKVRPELEQEEIEENMKTYVDQVGKILRTDEASFSWIRNSDWFYGIADVFFPEDIDMEITDADGKNHSLKLPKNSILAKAAIYDKTRMQETHLHKRDTESVTLRGLLWTLRNITHGRLIQRDMFQERISKGEELYMHEMLYPVFQGIDSFLIARIYGSCDLEVGGTDQTFNMLMGRDVMKVNGVEEQSVASFKLLTGTDGKEKMSKSLENYIAITDEPSDMYGKVMSIPDSSLENYYELCTYTPVDIVKEVFDEIKNGGNPRDAKMRLAKEIVSIYHGEAAAKDAESAFVNTFQKGGVPKELREVPAEKDAFETVKKFFDGEKSNTEIRGLFEQNAVSRNDEKIDIHTELKNGDVIKVGKKTWFKIS